MAVAAAKNTAVRPGFSFLICPDAQLLLEKVEEDAKAYAASSPAPLKRLNFWGDEPPESSFWSALSTMDLFGSASLVVVRQANLWPIAVWKLLDNVLSKPLGGSIPIFCLEDSDKGKIKIPAIITKRKCYQFAQKKGWIWEDQGLTDKTVAKYILDQAKSRGLVLSPAAVKYLAENTPRQAGVLAHELDKLTLLSDGKTPVTVDMLGTAQWSAEAKTFECISAILRGDLKGTWKEIAKLDLHDTTTALGFLGLVSWHFRTLWMLLVGEPTRAGLLKPALAQRLGHAKISKALNLIVETDHAIKTGTDLRQAVELLASRLLNLCHG